MVKEQNLVSIINMQCKQGAGQGYVVSVTI